jgi:outer membrane protein assembly factor BamB
VSLADGEIQWQLNVKSKFEARGELPWGYCGSPLIVDDKLIVTPGAADASVVALNLTTGEVVWKTPGGSASYGSLISGRFGGRHQVVGHDADTLGGWDVATGERLWSVKPEVGSDFNVPTPINLGGKLFVTTEGNGSRLFDFHTNGTINPIPVARNTRLHSNMSSAVVVKNSLYCVDRFLYCLDLQNGLQEKWRLRDPALGDYAAIIASPEYLLTIGSGELLLLKANGEPEIVSRLRIFPDTTPIYSHPAIVGKLLYIRGENTLKCINLDLRTPARSLRATPIDQVSESCVNE